MEIKELGLKGLFHIQPRVFGDDRGYFFEGFHKKKFADAGINEEFVQLNQSFSQKGVVRGLHFQSKPSAQGKLVRVTQGLAIDVAVDIRPNSPTFGESVAVELSAEKHNMLYVPPGFAHGFSTLEDTMFMYLCTDLYNPSTEGGVIWNDPDLNIDWGVDNPTVSDKDKILPFLKDINFK